MNAHNDLLHTLSETLCSFLRDMNRDADADEVRDALRAYWQEVDSGVVAKKVRRLPKPPPPLGEPWSAWSLVEGETGRAWICYHEGDDDDPPAFKWIPVVEDL